MDYASRVAEYKCPCCNAGLVFGDEQQKLTCEYCDNTFDIQTVKAFYEDIESKEEGFFWESTEAVHWNENEQNAIHGFQCPSCGGEILTDENTTATFCPYCDNPTILPSRLSGGLKPDAVIPFHTSKDDAKNAFLALCKGKPLLPKSFTEEQRLEKITGIYIPVWLYDCEADFHGSYKATRVHQWSDVHYRYTKTDHFLLKREARASFSGIPMDASTKMEDVFMESIEPYDYSQMKSFDLAYLSGYFADKYDVPSEAGENRIRQRVDNAIMDVVQSSLLGYTTAVPASKSIDIRHGKSKYVLLPVWILNTRFQDKIYTFAMNGQTGKITGVFPICPRRTAAWFLGISGCVSLLSWLIMTLFL